MRSFPICRLIRVLLVTQVINGLLLPVILIAVLRLVNNRELMGAYVNGRIYNMAAWLTTIIVTLLSLLLIIVTLFPGVFHLRRLWLRRQQFPLAIESNQ